MSKQNDETLELTINDLDEVNGAWLLGLMLGATGASAAAETLNESGFRDSEGHIQRIGP